MTEQPNGDSMAYEDTIDHLLAEFGRVARILDGYGMTIDQEPGPPQAFDDEGTTGVEPADLPIAVPPDVKREVQSVETTIQSEIEESLAAGRMLRLAHLVETFDLSANHRDVLLLALLPTVFPHFQNVYAELQNDLSATQPTVGFFADLFSETDEEFIAATRLTGPESPLRQNEFITIGEPEDTRLQRSERPVFVENRTEAYLLGHDGIDPVLDSILDGVSCERSLEDVRLDGHCLERVDQLATATPEMGGQAPADGELALEDGGEVLDTPRKTTPDDGDGNADGDSTVTAGGDHSGNEPGVRSGTEGQAVGRPAGRRFYWYGPEGTEKRGAAEVVTGGDTLLRGDLATILAAGALDRVRREAMMLDHPLHLESVTRATKSDKPDIPRIDDIFDQFEPFARDLVLTGSEEWTPARASTTSIDAIVEFSRPEFDIRKQFWEEHAGELPEDIDPTVLAGVFELTQGELETALATAKSLAGDDELTAGHVYRGCSSQSADELADLAEELDPDSTWEDIMLPEGTMRGLRTIASHINHKGRIYAEWAFNKRFSRGNGVVAMFSGPSGTGKTMAAEIIAADVGMKLYKIDLSSVVSKYIGETEENLERIFTEAEHSNAILLFDEADAVFGDRAGVQDATDRYANVEVNYLLQRIESYNGVVLLTTNYESNIDSAFMRRIDHSVGFRRPDEDIRREIWGAMFPEEAPLGDIDYEFLSDFQLTGGDIRTVAQTAAILAAADGNEIGMKHVVRGLQRELQKAGKMIDPQDFDDYREYLQFD